MPIEWQKNLETSIPALDSQHKGIFEAISEFSQKCSEGSPIDEVVKIVEMLENYTKEHFTYEENLQRYNNYPGLGEQQEQHKVFLEVVAELKNALVTDGPSKELAIATKGKLIRWLIQHVRNIDGKFAAFMKARIMGQ